MKPEITGAYTRSSLSLPSMADPAPTIEILPGVRAELLHDFSRFSDGKFIMQMFSCQMSADGKKVGALVTDCVGRWYVDVGEATYEVPMTYLFERFYAAHQQAVQA